MLFKKEGFLYEEISDYIFRHCNNIIIILLYLCNYVYSNITKRTRKLYFNRTINLFGNINYKSENTIIPELFNSE